MVLRSSLRWFTLALWITHINAGDILEVDTNAVEVTVGDSRIIQFFTNTNLTSSVEVSFAAKGAFETSPAKFTFLPASRTANVTVRGKAITSYDVLQVAQCAIGNDSLSCPFNNIFTLFVGVRVVHSYALSLAVIVVGWVYFTAWSISFYPQIILNYSRKSVVGLNFDFLLLNTIGFACYSVYNCFMYFDLRIQELYEATHPHSNIPVLANDVVFALHALFACTITASQCFFYKTGGQRISFVCLSISAAFVLFALSAVVQLQLGLIDAWQFITFLSYVKMASTLCKYFPQAILNFRRKSTVGWSIGNVLLDFLGGSMDILQMVLQGANTDDWSGFYGNMVKFGLGLVSIIFDVVFIIQHYVLYRNHDEKVDLDGDAVGRPSPNHKINVAERRAEDGNGSGGEDVNFLHRQAKNLKNSNK